MALKMKIASFLDNNKTEYEHTYTNVKFSTKYI